MSVKKVVYAIAPDGTITVVESTGNVGVEPYVAIGFDGNPVISWIDYVNDDLYVTKCNDPKCSGQDETTTLISDPGDQVWYNSVAIGDDGNPVIVYFDLTPSIYELKVVWCNDSACTGSDETISVVDAFAGFDNDIVIGNDGNPVIVYASGAGNLRVAWCDDPKCEGSNETITSIPVVGVDRDRCISMELNSLGNPVISHVIDTIDPTLGLTTCDDPKCESSVTNVVSSPSGWYSSLVFGVDGLPVISCYDYYNPPSIKVVKCDDVLCDGVGETVTVIDVGSYVDARTSIVLGWDGYPMFTYYDILDEDLKFVKCNDPACSGGDDLPEVIDDPDVVELIDAGWYPSMAIGGNGIPVIAYYDKDNGDLKVWYGESLTPLLDMVIDLEVNSDDSIGEIQVVTDENLDGTFTTKNSSETTGSNVTVGSDGVVDDLWLLELYPRAGSEWLYVKPQYYLSKLSGENDIGYRDYREGNSLTFAEAFECGDLNNDDQVSGPDFSLFVADYGDAGIGDFNGDSIVNGIDFAFFVNNYGSNGAYLTELINHGTTGESWTW